MGLADNLSCLIPEPERNCLDNNSSLDGAVQEMKGLYEERLPYMITEKINGFCLVWEDSFLALCRYAMSTDCMDLMTSEETQVWRNFVSFEDAHTYSATDEQCHGNAVGSTDPRIIQFDNATLPLDPRPVMLEDQPPRFTYKWDNDRQDFRLSVVPGVPDYPIYCLDEKSEMPLYDVPKAYVSDDLDGQFVKIHDCEPYNTCGCEDPIILENNDCHTPGTPPADPDAIYNDLYKTGCGTGYCSETVKK